MSTIVYVFLRKRVCDERCWPLVYTERVLAELCPDRVTEVVEVELEQVWADARQLVLGLGA